jgi:hypothetical protein
MEESAGIAAVHSLVEEDAEVWKRYKKSYNIRLDLPSSIRMLVHYQLSRCFDDLRRLNYRLLRTYPNEEERLHGEEDYENIQQLVHHLRRKYPTRERERQYYDRAVFRDARFLKEREAGVSFETARKKWKSRLRAMRHEAAQKLVAAGIRSATEQTRAELDVAREHQEEEQREWLEEDPRNVFDKTKREFSEKEKQAMRLDEELWKVKPAPGERALRRLLSQALVLRCRVTNAAIDDAERLTTHGVVGDDEDFQFESFDEKASPPASRLLQSRARGSAAAAAEEDVDWL